MLMNFENERKLIHDIFNALTIAKGMVNALEKDALAEKILEPEKKLAKIQKTLGGIDRAIANMKEIRELLINKDKIG